MKEVIYTGKRPYPFSLKVDYYEFEITFPSAKKGARLPDMVADKLVKEGPKAFMIGQTQMEVIPPAVDASDIIDEIDVDIPDVPCEISEAVPPDCEPQVKAIEDMNALELKAYAKELPLKGYTKYNTEDLREELIKDRDAKKVSAEIIEGSELNAH
jgi:hypothetical protein